MTIDLDSAPTVRGPMNATPARRPGSVRRTSSIDMTWPGGRGTQLRLLGRARDLLTPADGGPPRVLAEDVMRVGVALDRTIEDITTEPPRPTIGGLVGARGGGRLRGILGEVVPAERAAGTPLYLLLDDIAGASLISGFAYSQWTSEWMSPKPGQPSPRRRMEGICTGFQPGSSALDRDGTGRMSHRTRPVDPLPASDDPRAWHHLDDITDVSMRRARRIDVRLAESGVLEVDAMFQDSATTPAGGRVAVHEYQVTATADPATGELLTVEADPRVLPYAECPLAVRNIEPMIGTRLADLRQAVLDELKGIRGCTHLNDALRALAEVPVLARPLLDGSTQGRPGALSE
ncbi:DUF2889 domain-containing protein [Pseudonocardia kunmingensis]|uniref:DUF2889 family protein n=1 Tax=Pseudonocardia kunmingensis TaxID=630975 RepID=A0A543DPQ0_9PSEU|nr:DUF2889 domain-containing protein [Pseudonocardia kunmingensis]TQM11307.1 DUF2889 family protein [Pseudonocardia kunmingensis]